MPRFENEHVDAALCWGVDTVSGSQRLSDITTRQIHHPTYSGPNVNANGLA
jgi:hypothetical protein